MKQKNRRFERCLIIHRTSQYTITVRSGDPGAIRVAREVMRVALRRPSHARAILLQPKLIIRVHRTERRWNLRVCTCQICREHRIGMRMELARQPLTVLADSLRAISSSTHQRTGEDRDLIGGERWRASSEARNTVGRATSSGRPARPSGVMATNWTSAGGSALRRWESRVVRASGRE
jgi:hypothetical protein